MISGLYGAYAIMVALRVVERGGKGQVIDCAAGADDFRARSGRGDLHGQWQAATARQPSLTTSPRNVTKRATTAIAISASIRRWRSECSAPSQTEMIDDRVSHQHGPGGNIDACDAGCGFIAARTLAETWRSSRPPR